MLKPILLATSMMIAAPVLAQTAPAQTTSPATTQPATPAGQQAPMTSGATAPSAPVAGNQVQTAPQPGTAPVQSAGTATAEPAPASGGSQVAQIVDREFGAYDKDADGKLSQAEFDTWMVALRTASDPTSKADSPETKKWLGAAFAQADADKNSGVTKAELTGFLSQGQS